MLTRGWTSYDWSKLTTKHVSLEQQKETGIGIQGKFYKQTKNTKPVIPMQIRSAVE